MIHFKPFEVRHAAPAAASPSKHQSLQDHSGKKGRKAPPKPAEIKFEGEEDTCLNSPDFYACPLYKTGERAGTLNTTGQSTNYILSIDVPIDSQENDRNHWTLRGTALLASLAS